MSQAQSFPFHKIFSDIEVKQRNFQDVRRIFEENISPDRRDAYRTNNPSTLNLVHDRHFQPVVEAGLELAKFIDLKARGLAGAETDVLIHFGKQPFTIQERAKALKQVPANTRDMVAFLVIQADQIMRGVDPSDPNIAPHARFESVKTALGEIDYVRDGFEEGGREGGLNAITTLLQAIAQEETPAAVAARYGTRVEYEPPAAPVKSAPKAQVPAAAAQPTPPPAPTPQPPPEPVVQTPAAQPVVAGNRSATVRAEVPFQQPVFTPVPNVASLGAEVRRDHVPGGRIPGTSFRQMVPLLDSVYRDFHRVRALFETEVKKQSIGEDYLVDTQWTAQLAHHPDFQPIVTHGENIKRAIMNIGFDVVRGNSEFNRFFPPQDGKSHPEFVFEALPLLRATAGSSILPYRRLALAGLMVQREIATYAVDANSPITPRERIYWLNESLEKSRRVLELAGAMQENSKDTRLSEFLREYAEAKGVGSAWAMLGLNPKAPQTEIEPYLSLAPVRIEASQSLNWSGTETPAPAPTPTPAPAKPQIPVPEPLRAAITAPPPAPAAAAQPSTPAAVQPLPSQAPAAPQPPPAPVPQPQLLSLPTMAAMHQLSEAATKWIESTGQFLARRTEISEQAEQQFGPGSDNPEKGQYIGAMLDRDPVKNRVERADGLLAARSYELALAISKTHSGTLKNVDGENFSRDKFNRLAPAPKLPDGEKLSPLEAQLFSATATFYNNYADTQNKKIGRAGKLLEAQPAVAPYRDMVSGILEAQLITASTLEPSLESTESTTMAQTANPPYNTFFHRISSAQGTWKPAHSNFSRIVDSNAHLQTQFNSDKPEDSRTLRNGATFMGVTSAFSNVRLALVNAVRDDLLAHKQQALSREAIMAYLQAGSQEAFNSNHIDTYVKASEKLPTGRRNMILLSLIHLSAVDRAIRSQELDYTPKQRIETVQGIFKAMESLKGVYANQGMEKGDAMVTDVLQKVVDMKGPFADIAAKSPTVIIKREAAAPQPPIVVAAPAPAAPQPPVAVATAAPRPPAAAALPASAPQPPAPATPPPSVPSPDVLALDAAARAGKIPAVLPPQQVVAALPVQTPPAAATAPRPPAPQPPVVAAPAPVRDVQFPSISEITHLNGHVNVALFDTSFRNMANAMKTYMEFEPKAAAEMAQRARAESWTEEERKLRLSAKITASKEWKAITNSIENMSQNLLRAASNLAHPHHGSVQQRAGMLPESPEFSRPGEWTRLENFVFTRLAVLNNELNNCVGHKAGPMPRMERIELMQKAITQFCETLHGIGEHAQAATEKVPFGKRRSDVPEAQQLPLEETAYGPLLQRGFPRVLVATLDQWSRELPAFQKESARIRLDAFEDALAGGWDEERTKNNLAQRLSTCREWVAVRETATYLGQNTGEFLKTLSPEHDAYPIVYQFSEAVNAALAQPQRYPRNQRANDVDTAVLALVENAATLPVVSSAQAPAAPAPASPLQPPVVVSVPEPAQTPPPATQPVPLVVGSGSRIEVITREPREGIAIPSDLPVVRLDEDMGGIVDVKFDLPILHYNAEHTASLTTLTNEAITQWNTVHQNLEEAVKLQATEANNGKSVSVCLGPKKLPTTIALVNAYNRFRDLYTQAFEYMGGEVERLSDKEGDYQSLADYIPGDAAEMVGQIRDGLIVRAHATASKIQEITVQGEIDKVDAARLASIQTSVDEVVQVMRQVNPDFVPAGSRAQMRGLGRVTLTDVMRGGVTPVRSETPTVGHSIDPKAIERN